MRESSQIQELERQLHDCVSVINQGRYYAYAGSALDDLQPDDVAQAISSPSLDGAQALTNQSLSNAASHTQVRQIQQDSLIPVDAQVQEAQQPREELTSNPNEFIPRIKRPPARTSRRLGPIELDEGQIDEMYKIFFDHYHPFLPYLDLFRSPDEDYMQSPLLFWSIIAVASRRYEQDAALLRFLASPVSRLAWQTAQVFPSTLSSIQALLLLCTWPFPTSSLWQEPTPVWVSMAVSMAQQLGLPSPDRGSEFCRVKSNFNALLEVERVRTWAACAIVTQNVSASFGTLPMTCHALSIHSSLEEEYTRLLPHSLRQFFTFSRFCHRISTVLSETFSIDADTSPTAEGTGLLPSLEAELHQLEQTVDVSWAPTRLSLLSTRMLLYLHFIYLPGWAECKKRGVLQSYAIAQQLIAQSSDAEGGNDALNHLTGSLIRALFTAACIIWKVLNSSYHTEVDLVAGRTSFNQAVRALRRCSIENNDNAGRQSEILVHLWKGTEIEQYRNRCSDPTVRYRARYGASLAYDCLFFWRDMVGGQAAKGLHISSTIPVDGARETSTVGLDAPPETFDPVHRTAEPQGNDWAPGDWGLDTSLLLFSQI